MIISDDISLDNENLLYKNTAGKIFDCLLLDDGLKKKKIIGVIEVMKSVISISKW